MEYLPTINIIIEYISTGLTTIGMKLTVKMNKIWSVLIVRYFNLVPVSNMPMVGQCSNQSYVTCGARCKVTHVAIVLSAMLCIVSMQPGQAHVQYYTALIHTTCCAIDNVGNRYAEERIKIIMLHNQQYEKTFHMVSHKNFKKSHMIQKYALCLLCYTNGITPFTSTE